jgi:hypothetical protein
VRLSVSLLISWALMRTVFAHLAYRHWSGLIHELPSDPWDIWHHLRFKKDVFQHILFGNGVNLYETDEAVYMIMKNCTSLI